MPDKIEEYRQHAKEAQHEADTTADDLDKASWLKIAQGWLNLIREREPQKKSGSSH